MKTSLIAILLFVLAGCGSAGSNTQVAVPADADLKADVMFQGSGPARTIEVSFYFSRSVAPGEKTAPEVEMIQVEEARFNDTPLNAGTSAPGRTFYTAPNLSVKPENVISAKLNGKQYEGKAMTQTTLPNKSATIVLMPK